VLSPDEASRLIGQFGLGFLSSFLIASEVGADHALGEREQPDAALGVRPGTFTTMSPRAGGEVGTTVELKIKPGTAFVLNEDILLETVRPVRRLSAGPDLRGATIRCP